MSDGIDCEIYLTTTDNCTNGYDIHNWRTKKIKTVKHPQEEKKYRVCNNCKEARPMYVNKEVKLLTERLWGCGDYQPLDDIDDLYVTRRPPMDLWKLLLTRVLKKLNPLVIEDKDIIHCRRDVDTCKCHGRYMRDCPFDGKPTVDYGGTMSWGNTKHIKPLEKPWCDIPLPLGPNGLMMTSKEFYAKWKRVHGKSLEYLKYHHAHQKFPENPREKSPKWLMDSDTTILEGEFIQLSL